MAKIKLLFPEISRPLEYVAFLNFYFDTLEGPGYVFMACDGYSEFAFKISIEPDESPASVIKAIYLLTENEDFKLHRDNGFTLVFDKWEQLSDRIESIITPFDGKVLFNKRFHEKISMPLVLGMNELMKGRS